MALMNCSIGVNTRAPGWADNVRSVLYSIHGVRTVNIDGYGLVEVSGFDVQPEVLIWKLARAGYRAMLCSMQLDGCCSSNSCDHLYGCVRHHGGGGYYGHMNGYDDHHGGYGYNRPFARLAYELRQKLTAPPPPPPLTPRPRTVYVPRHINDRPGCCSLM